MSLPFVCIPVKARPLVSLQVTAQGQVSRVPCLCEYQKHGGKRVERRQHHLSITGR